MRTANTSGLSYDSMGRVLTTTDATGAIAANRYDTAGNLTLSMDRRGYATELEYDDLDRVIEVRRSDEVYEWDAVNLAITTDTAKTRWYEISTTEYDEQGNVRFQTRYDVDGLTLAQVPADPSELLNETLYPNQGTSAVRNDL